VVPAPGGKPHFCEAAGSEICLHWALSTVGHLVRGEWGAMKATPLYSTKQARY
jgi:hypothetical protein